MSNPNYIMVPAGRWTGATTRTIDAAVQALFEGKKLFFPTKGYIERLQKDNYRGRKCTLFVGWEEEYKELPVIDLDWKVGESQDNMTRRFLKRLDFEHEMTLHVKSRENGFTFSLEDFKKGARSAVIKNEYTELWTVGLLDRKDNFVITRPNLDYPEPEKIFFTNRTQADEEKRRRRENDGCQHRVYIYASSNNRLGVQRIKPFVEIKDAVAELKKVEEEQKRKSQDRDPYGGLGREADEPGNNFR